METRTTPSAFAVAGHRLAHKAREAIPGIEILVAVESLVGAAERRIVESVRERLIVRLAHKPI